MIVRCTQCNIELTSSSKAQCCGCSNRMVLLDDTISAEDLSKVLIVNHEESIKDHSFLTKDQLQWQEDRRKRKVRKLDFEIR